MIKSNREFKIELEIRTKKFAVDIVKFCMALLKETNIPAEIITQLIKCGTSIGANYREANRAESRKDFIHKIGIVEKEASETEYWLEIIDAILENVKLRSQLIILLQESRELLALFTTISKNTKNSHHL